MRDTERDAETQAEGEAGSMQGAWCGTPSRVSRIMPWAEGGTKPLSHLAIPEEGYFKEKVQSAAEPVLYQVVSTLAAYLALLDALYTF